MSAHCKTIWAFPLFALAAGISFGNEQPPSYARNVKPFLTHFCLECHNAKEAESGLNLETYQSLLAGGDHGPVLTPGKADASRIVRMVEGKTRPAMPPKKARQPKPEERTVLRSWINGGARDDSSAVRVALPAIKPRQATLPPIAALAYRSDGKLLAAAGNREVLLLDPERGEVVGARGGGADRVTALAFSRDGRHLAVAGGNAGAAGEVLIYAAVPPAFPGSQPTVRIAAHRDLIHDVAFSPDGKILATCGYDRLIRLWDVSDGTAIRELRDHSDAVYSVAFSADGRLLASGAADRAVKVWDLASGRRLYTLGESTDWVYAVAWSPTGHLLAAAGVDKSLRVWEATSQGGRILHSVFAHEKPVNRLVYAADGRTIYSLSEDGGLKAWDAGRMVERMTYARQPEAVLSLAVRPDHKQIALGRYDGALLLLDETTGKTQAQTLPARPRPPKLAKVTPAAGTRGHTVRVKLEGANLAGTRELVTTIAGLKTSFLNKPETEQAEVAVTIPPATAAGVYQVAIKTEGGQSGNIPFTVDSFAPVGKDEGHDSPRTAQHVSLPVTLVGAIGRAGDVDYFRCEAAAGQEIGVQALTGILGSKLEPILEWLDAEGRVLVESGSGLLGFTCPRPGMYILSIRDREYRGEPGMTYRVHVGSIPVVTGVFPLGLRRGTAAEVHLDGVNLGPGRKVLVKAPASAEAGTHLPVQPVCPPETPLGNPTVVVGEFPEVAEGDKAMSLPVPGTANGRIAEPGTAQTWKFKANKGQRLIVETLARRLGAPLDSTIEILDAAGRPLPLATLRGVARTYIAFRDQDSASTGIRLETWSELAINDYLLAGGEVLRIKALPKNPDDDCQFFSAGGRRLGYLGTTPAHHPMGLPMYKVQVHPPRSTFPPNGLPVVTLHHRNDDGGGPGYDKDSRLFFDPPADGDYQVRVGDARGQGGQDYAYRLTIRSPRPSFTVRFNPTSPTVSKGDGVAINVTAERMDGFEDPIELRLANLPPGFTAPVSSIPVDENGTSLTMFADALATVPTGAPPLKLVARAVIGGKEIVQEVTGGSPKLVEPGNLRTTTDLSEVTVRPGGETRLTVSVERRNGFKGRVPLEVRGLPHGVRVLDIGLNGILITPMDSSRTVVIYAEPWVKPTVQPLVVLARSEGKGTEHAARSVTLRVAGKSP